MVTLSLDDNLSSISSLYRGIRSDLVDISTEIQVVFNNLLRSKASDYGLTYVNSAYPGYYFSFSPRVKEEESLEEKLVRSGQLLYLIEKSDEQILIDLYNMNDLIGIKILGELEEDVSSIVKLIRDNQSILLDQGITFLSNFSEKPVPMKNGLDIFKYNCSYTKTVDGKEFIYLFELQIKSKLLSAWGDMEHRIFYKDYMGTAVRNSVQQLMNKVGSNLKSIDSLLHTIRISNSNYLLEKEFYLFMEDIQKIFTKQLKVYLKTSKNFNLNQIVTILFEFMDVRKSVEDKSLFDVNFESIVIPEITEMILQDNYKYLDLFNKLKKYSFNVRILEYIYTSSVYFKYESNKINNDILIDQQDDFKIYAQILYDFLEEYKIIVLKKYSDFSIDELYEEESYLNDIFNFIFANSKSEDVLLLSNKYKLVLDFYSNFKATYNTEFEDVFEESMMVPGIEQGTVDISHRENYYLITKLFALYVFERETDFSHYLSEDLANFFRDENEQILDFMKLVHDNIKTDNSIKPDSKLEEEVIKFTNQNSLLGSVDV